MGFLSIVIAVAGLASSWAYSSGATNCGTINHGTFQSALPSGMTLSLVDTSTSSAVTQWSAGKTYTVQIQSTSAFKGWSWAPLKGTPASFTAGTSSMAGSFTPGDSYSHANTGCAGSITQTSGGTSRTLVKATWVAPAAGTGTVSLWALISVSKNGNNYNAVQTVTELVAGSTPAAGSITPTTSRVGSGSSTSTHTHTGTMTKSKGASESGSSSSMSTVTSIPSSMTIVTYTPSPSGAVVAVQTVPSSVHTNIGVTSAAASVNIVAVAIGSAFAGAALVGLAVAVVMSIRRTGRKMPLNHAPAAPTTMMGRASVSNILADTVADETSYNPYMKSYRVSAAPQAITM